MIILLVKYLTYLHLTAMESMTCLILDWVTVLSNVQKSESLIVGELLYLNLVRTLIFGMVEHLQVMSVLKVFTFSPFQLMERAIKETFP